MSKPERKDGSQKVTAAILAKYRRLHELMAECRPDYCWPDDMQAQQEAERLKFEINQHFGLNPGHEPEAYTAVAEQLAEAAGLEPRENRNWFSVA